MSRFRRIPHLALPGRGEETLASARLPPLRAGTICVCPARDCERVVTRIKSTQSLRPVNYFIPEEPSQAARATRRTCALWRPAAQPWRTSSKVRGMGEDTNALDRVAGRGRASFLRTGYVSTHRLEQCRLRPLAQHWPGALHLLHLSLPLDADQALVRTGRSNLWDG